MTIHAAPFSPSFLWKEVPRRGGGWPRETVPPHSGKPTPPRFARLPLPEEGARMFFKEILIQSLSFAVSDSRFPPHMPRCSAFLICLSCRQCPIRPFGAPSPRGEGSVSRIPLSPSNLRPFGAPPSKGRREHPREPLPLEGAAVRSEAGLASFFAAKPPPLYLPHWGRGTAPAALGYFRKLPA